MSFSNSASIRENLIKHLAKSRHFHYEAKKILKLETKNLGKTIRNVAENENLTFWKLKKKVEILKEKQKYFALKHALEADPINPDIYNIARKNKFPIESLYKEMKKRGTMGRLYRYDPVIQLQNVFTFSEENKIMNNLCAWEGTNDCKCQLCALIHLSDIAYESAKKKATCPKNWNTKANLKWLYYFEMRHTKLFRKNFDSVKECKNFQSQVLQLFIEQHISGSSSSSASMQGNQSSSFNISPMLDYEVVSQLSTISGLQLPIDVSSQAGTSHARRQGSSPSFQEVSDVPKTVRSHSREEIQNYLKLDGLLEPAAKEVLDENKDMEQVAQNYGLDLKDLESKVYIIQCTRDYWKKNVNMKKAVKDVQNSPTTLETIAKNYDIHAFVLRTEYNRYLRIILNKDNTYSYEYDQFSANNCAVFTFMEESLLLQQLQFLKDVLQCPCQICALDFLLSLSYDFAQRTNKIHPWSEHKEADCNWLFQFIKGHTDEISIFEPPHSCKIKSRARTNGSETSSSVDLEENVVRSILDVPLQLQEGCQQTEEFFNDLTMLDIRSRIKSHLELSTRLDEAADEVIEKNKDIASVALKHNLDFWILKRKVQILKMKHNYIDLKNKFEKAINYTILHKSPFDIARDNMIDERQLKAEYMKYLEKRRLHPNYTYQYDETITPNRVFTYSEEKSLLQKLSHWKEDSRCPCQLCALQYLLKLAHQFATENRITCPIGWIEAEIADEVWLLEFEMRYSRKEIPEFFKHVSTCKIESLGQEEPNTSQAKHFKSSQTSNVHKSDIKDRIKSHLELSRRLDKAAKKIEKHKDVASAARQYELDPWIVKQKMHILNLRKEQFNMKNKLEPPINDIIYNRISILNAATKYAVDKDFIEKTLKEFENSECDIYTYDMLTMDDGVFTFREEFSLLNRLRLKSEDLKCCRSCTLQHLSSLAYQDAEQNKKQYPSAWNTDKKADEIWIYEYEMRHSVEISKYFNDECKAEEILASMSASQS